MNKINLFIQSIDKILKNNQKYALIIKLLNVENLSKWSS